MRKIGEVSAIQSSKWQGVSMARGEYWGYSLQQMAEIAGFVLNSKAAVSLKYGVSQSGPIIVTFLET